MSERRLVRRINSSDDEATVATKGIITAHYITHWGVPSDIRPLTVEGLGDFAIVEFPPRDSRKTWRYATNGMSAYAQARSGTGRELRMELYASTARPTRNLDDVLALVARYPIDHQTRFCEGDTIAAEGAISEGWPNYAGLLIAGPESPGLGLIGGPDRGVLLNRIVGIFDDELELAKTRGGHELLVKLQAEDLPIDILRDRVVKRFGVS